MAIKNKKLGGTDFPATASYTPTGTDFNDTFDAAATHLQNHGGNTAEMAYKTQQTTGFENGGNIMTEKATDVNGLQNTIELVTPYKSEGTTEQSGVTWTNSANAFDLNDSTNASTGNYAANLTVTLGKVFTENKFVRNISINTTYTRQNQTRSVDVWLQITTDGASWTNYTKIIDLNINSGSTSYNNIINVSNIIKGYRLRATISPPSSAENNSWIVRDLSYEEFITTLNFDSANNYYKITTGELKGNITQNINTLKVYGDKKQVQPRITGYHLDTASYANKSMSVNQGTYPQAMAFNNDGTKVFVLDHLQYRVYEHNLSTPYDTSTATYTNKFQELPQANQPFGLEFSPDGTKIFVTAQVNNSVYQWSMTTAWDISTIQPTPTVLATPESSPYDLKFGKNGTRLYVVGIGNDRVYQYNLSTAYDISSASDSGKSLYVNPQDRDPTAVEISDDGSKLFILGSFSDRVYQYNLSNPWEVDSATYSNISHQVTEDISSLGMTFRPNGEEFYIVGQANRRIYEYSMISKHTVIEVNQTKTNGFIYHYEGDLPYGSRATVQLKGFGTKSLSKTGVAFDDTSQTFPEPSGVKINFLFNKHITTITKAVGCTATKCYIRFNNGTIVAQADFVGNFATFNRDFSAGNYIIDVDNSGSNYVSQRQVSPSFPIQTTNVHYNIGSFNQQDFNTLYNILSINTGEIITTDKIEVDSETKKAIIPIGNMDNEENVEINTEVSRDETTIEPNWKGMGMTRY